jgi:hypothetical protein
MIKTKHQLIQRRNHLKETKLMVKDMLYRVLDGFSGRELTPSELKRVEKVADDLNNLL